MEKRHRKYLIRIIATVILFLGVYILEKIVPNLFSQVIFTLGVVKFNISILIYICMYLIIGYDILYKAFRNIFSGHLLDENFLMTIASVAAFFVSEYSEAITVMLLYQIGELFQRIAVDKSRKSIADLMDICPEYTNVLKNVDDLQSVEVDSDEVDIGTLIMIKVGERIPLDCKVIKGETLIDSSALTGESIPINVGPGDEILSGSINTSSVIVAETIREFEDSTATKILDLVENASYKKSKSENFITKFAKYYTPIVVGIAVALAFVPTLLFGQQWSPWINRACIFLITSCPCALVISIPLTFFGGIGKASRKGILVKGSNYLEELSKIDTVVFDKTGTLTKGNFMVSSIKPIECDEEELINMCVVAERYSNHPIARAIMQYYEESSNNINSNNINSNNINSNNINNNNINCDDINKNSNNIGNNIDKNISKNISMSNIGDSILDRDWRIDEIPGKGLIASYNNNYIYVGNESLMKDNCVEKYEPCTEIGTVVYVAYNKQFKGYIVINDEIKDNSSILIEDLKKIGVNKTVMLTGDKKTIGENIAKELGLSEVYTELLPSDKVDKLEEIINNKKNGSTVAYVGDGINDAPVLARADIGISMGGISSDVAIEASDIVLMDDNLLKIIDAIKYARTTMKVVKQNIVFALGIKFIVLVLGVFGLANMWWAIFADVGVMVIAILNAIFGIKERKLKI